jgi:hypothetical protein
VTEPIAEPGTTARDTVEAVVRDQLARAMGGRRGVLEAAVPTVLFTVSWLSTKSLELALTLSVGAAAILLVIRLAQRSTIQYVVNAAVGIGVGWVFIRLAARSGGDQNEQALAYFLPGLIYNAGYAVALSLSCLIGWPLIGFLVGSATGDPTAWHRDRQVVLLCQRLTWLMTVPCAARVLVQVPVWFAGKRDVIEPDTAVAALAVLKLGMGWPLQVAAFTAMGWLLMRNRMPVSDSAG